MRTLLLRRLSTLYFCCLLLACSASVRRVASPHLGLRSPPTLPPFSFLSLSQKSCLSSPWPSVATYSSSIQLPQPQSGELPLLTLAFGRLLPSLLTLSSAQARYGLAPSSSSPSPCSSSTVFLFFVIFPHLHSQSVLLVHLQRAGQHMHLCEFTQCYEQEA
ncbi:hypothetical protein GUITHDRAFT_154332, partial [Guillardia theta CCMP2712]